MSNYELYNASYSKQRNVDPRGIIPSSRPLQPLKRMKIINPLSTSTTHLYEADTPGDASTDMGDPVVSFPKQAIRQIHDHNSGAGVSPILNNLMYEDVDFTKGCKRVEYIFRTIARGAGGGPAGNLAFPILTDKSKRGELKSKKNLFKLVEHCTVFDFCLCFHGIALSHVKYEFDREKIPQPPMLAVIERGKVSTCNTGEFNIKPYDSVYITLPPKQANQGGFKLNPNRKVSFTRKNLVTISDHFLTNLVIDALKEADPNFAQQNNDFHDFAHYTCLNQLDKLFKSAYVGQCVSMELAHPGNTFPIVRQIV